MMPTIHASVTKDETRNRRNGRRDVLAYIMKVTDKFGNAKPGPLVGKTIRITYQPGGHVSVSTFREEVVKKANSDEETMNREAEPFGDFTMFAEDLDAPRWYTPYRARHQHFTEIYAAVLTGHSNGYVEVEIDHEELRFHLPEAPAC